MRIQKLMRIFVRVLFPLFLLSCLHLLPVNLVLEKKFMVRSKDKKRTKSPPKVIDKSANNQLEKLDVFQSGSGHY